jgi:nucleotide-binding universal stress UspA family protein
MAIDHIACAVDGSEQSKRAVLFAARMSIGLNAKLSLLCVRRVVMDRSTLRGNNTPDDVDALLATAATIARDACCTNLDAIHLHGQDVAQLLASCVEDRGIDLVVMGCKVKGAIQRLSMGSTIMNFVRQSTCPITLIQ